MQFKSLALFATIVASVAAAPLSELDVPSYADFPEGILPLDFSVEDRAVSLGKRACPGGNFGSCVPILGQICVFGCGLRRNFSCLIGCPISAQEECQESC
ncbi:hypothetical protein EsH8_VIII_000137 [Colletotrichum jinshuiense]